MKDVIRELKMTGGDGVNLVCSVCGVCSHPLVVTSAKGMVKGRVGHRVYTVCTLPPELKDANGFTTCSSLSIDGHEAIGEIFMEGSEPVGKCDGCNDIFQCSAMSEMAVECGCVCDECKRNGRPKPDSLGRYPWEKCDE